MSTPTPDDQHFDTAAAVTRSLLGWGVVVGPFYLVVGIALALTRPGFDLTRHQLSLLMLGDHGWMQATNLVLSGAMTLAAALGFVRAMPSGAGRWAGALVGAFGLGLIESGVFPPDPVAGFPPGASTTGGTISGLLHLAFGAAQFAALAAAAFVIAHWFARRGDRRTSRLLRGGGVVVAVGLVGGAVLSTMPVGVGLLWIAVVAGWSSLLWASARAYRAVPHPDGRGAATPPHPPGAGERS